MRVGAEGGSNYYHLAAPSSEHVGPPLGNNNNNNNNNKLSASNLGGSGGIISLRADDSLPPASAYPASPAGSSTFQAYPERVRGEESESWRSKQLPTETGRKR